MLIEIVKTVPQSNRQFHSFSQPIFIWVRLPGSKIRWTRKTLRFSKTWLFSLYTKKGPRHAEDVITSPTNNGGLRVRGTEAKLKRRPSDNVIILSQPRWSLLIKTKIRPTKYTFLRLRHDWHSRRRKCKRVFMMHNFENTESWECWQHINVRQLQVGIVPTSLFLRPAFTINKL